MILKWKTERKKFRAQCEYTFAMRSVWGGRRIQNLTSISATGGGGASCQSWGSMRVRVSSLDQECNFLRPARQAKRKKKKKNQTQTSAQNAHAHTHTHTIRIHYDQLVFHRTPKWNSPGYWWEDKPSERRPGIDNTINGCICTQSIQMSRGERYTGGMEGRGAGGGVMRAVCINLGFLGIQ